jgi:hypothetical protein
MVQRGAEQLEKGGDRTLVFLERAASGDSVEVQVTLIGDESVREVHFFMDSDGKPKPIEKDNLATVQAVLDNNRQQGYWQAIPVHLLGDGDRDGEDDFVLFWSRSDNRRTTAQVQPKQRHALIIETDEFKRAREGAQAGRVPQEAVGIAKTPAADRELVARVIGTVSPKYTERGYRDVTLGMSFDDVKSAKGLDYVKPDAPFIFSNTDKFLDLFYFDAEDKLVCFRECREGGVDDYLEGIVNVFGKTDNEAHTYAIDYGSWMQRISTIPYSFQHVLVSVDFRSTIRASNSEATLKRATFINVLDREWAEKVLLSSVAAKRPLVAWLKAAAHLAASRNVDVNVAPKLPGVRFAVVGDVVAVYDATAPAEDPATQAPCGLYGFEVGKRTAQFVFPRYAPTRGPKLKRGATNGNLPAGLNTQRARLVLERKEDPALEETPVLQSLDFELGSLLLQSEFVPKDGKVVAGEQTAGRPAYHRWEADAGDAGLVDVNYSADGHVSLFLKHE